MAQVYRVHPFLAGAMEGEKGHATYLPPVQSGGRIDNKEYKSFYVADSPAGAIAESFGNWEIWNSDLFDGPPSLAGSVMGMSILEGNLQVVDLDEPQNLRKYGLRPSRVVTRHYTLTQAWALEIFASGGGGDGVSWWSYHDPDWRSFGLWGFNQLKVVETTPLSVASPGFTQARRVLNRSFVR